ncbi:putative TOS1-like glycosyl hydrolase-domain-containing protein [Lipomyces arxii]|uniref:putative TOS1-like glycosyl hydrolase-domain-containing protein n=1 Tax=Lipomyces arxii TaxID=56418 RepID=UPI0034CD5EA7
MPRWHQFILALLAVASTTTADCTFMGGNYYCDDVSAVAYDNVGFSGSYNDVTSMDNCQCETAPVSFSGPLAPLNEDVSLHFRGPMRIKQIAVYTSGSNPEKRSIDDHEQIHEHSLEKRHAHHQHKRHARHEKRAVALVTEVVTMYQTVYYNPDESVISTAEPSPTTISTESIVYSSDAALETTSLAVVKVPEEAGATPTSEIILTTGAPTTVVSVGPMFTTSATPPPDSVIEPAVSSEPSSTFMYITTSAESTTTSTSSSATATETVISTSDWGQVGYYNAESGISNGLTFMNNLGGSNGSGVWSSCWGNSLSYCNTDGQTAAANSQILGDVLIPSNTEVIVFSDTSCNNANCGYYRDGIPAYYGFGGDMKLFLLEFSMPSDASAGFNADMPAVWFLNGKVPRTSQYGSCSCWTTGCGEFDAFEVLSSGSDYLTSHLHTWQGTNTNYGGGGTGDYFTRPTESTMKAAVIFDGSDKAIRLIQLDDATDFGSSIAADVIAGWLAISSTIVSIAS